MEYEEALRRAQRSAELNFQCMGDATPATIDGYVHRETQRLLGQKVTKYDGRRTSSGSLMDHLSTLAGTSS